MSAEVVSRLAKIEVSDDSSPFDLFQQWFDSAKIHLPAFHVRVVNIATVSKNGVVSNRSIIMQDFDDEGLLFNTSRKSRKHNDINEHEQVSLCFFWCYPSEDQICCRQVRMEGIAKEMQVEFTRERFRTASFRTKMRLDFCQQGNEIDWDTLKKRHEQYLEEHKNANIDMPSDVVYYKVIPNRFEFYESVVDPITIGDRILFRKNAEGKWYFVHLEA